MPKKEQVDFSLLDSVGPGDTLRLQFTQQAEVEDLAQLKVMIDAGTLTSPYTLVLLDCCQLNHWPFNGSRRFTVTLTESFDRDWFERRMAGKLDLLEIFNQA